MDAHFHLNYLPRERRQEMIERAMQKGVVGGLVAGVWNTDGPELLEILANQKLFFTFQREKIEEQWQVFLNEGTRFGVFLSHGLHPTCIHAEWLNETGQVLEDKIEADIRKFRKFVATYADKIWAIGETGFDTAPEVTKHRNCLNLKKEQILALQKRACDACIEVASEFSLPLIFHSRSAWNQTLESIRTARAKKIDVMVHCYGGSAEELKNLNKLDVFVSFGGVPTWKRAVRVRESYCAAKLESVMLETDAPDLPPELEDGSKPATNEPFLLTDIANILAQLKGVDAASLIKVANANLLRFLGLQNLQLS